jgi:hypothetical protein
MSGRFWYLSRHYSACIPCNTTSSRTTTIKWPEVCLGDRPREIGDRLTAIYLVRLLTTWTYMVYPVVEDKYLEYISIPMAVESKTTKIQQ